MLIVIDEQDVPAGEVVTADEIRNARAYVVTLKSGRRAWMLAERRSEVRDWIDERS